MLRRVHRRGCAHAYLACCCALLLAALGGFPVRAGARAVTAVAGPSPSSPGRSTRRTDCSLTGQWDGVKGTSDAFTVTDDGAGSVHVFSNYPNPTPTNADGYPGWASALGSRLGNAVSLTRDYSPLSPATMTGTVDSSCSTIAWSDGTSWTRMQTITKVHMIGMNHLDVGYNGIHPTVGFIANVMNKYFTTYFPRAIAISNALRTLGGTERFIYTTHPWLVSMYVDCPPHLVLSGIQLECPDAPALKRFEDAVLRGDIVWHAGPYNLQPENCGDPGIFDYSLTIAEDLNTKFFGAGNRTTITLSQRDVPGMTRGVIPLLAKRGITALSVGVNPSTAPPAVPKAFVWKDEQSGTDVMAMWHPGGYPDNPGPNANDAGGLVRSGCVTVPGLPEAMCWAFRTDNSGPPESVNEVLGYYETIRGQFPGAEVVASTFDEFTQVLATVKDSLPVVSGEVGDTWIMGIASDVKKEAEYREIVRARKECIDRGACDADSAVMKNFTRFLLKTPEHTWGIPSLYDNANWANDQFEKVRNNVHFKNGENTWIEQRYFNELAIQALGSHPLAAEIRTRLAALQAAVPSLAGLHRVDPSVSLSCVGAATKYAFDPSSGAIASLVVGGTTWADAAHPAALLTYETYIAANFTNMDNQYDYFGNAGFAKDNVTEAHPQCNTYAGVITEMYASTDGCSAVVKTEFTAESWTKYGAPQTAWTTVDVHPGRHGAVLEIGLQLFNKTATRLPEGVMYSFEPPQASTTLGSGQYDWYMDKLGELVSPMDVVVNGSQHQHGVWTGVQLNAPGSSSSNPALVIEPFDAPLVLPSTAETPATPFPVPLTPLASKPQGMVVNLINNIWNTNYPQYYPYTTGLGNENMRFRFNVTLSAT